MKTQWLFFLIKKIKRFPFHWEIKQFGKPYFLIQLEVLLIAKAIQILKIQSHLYLSFDHHLTVTLSRQVPWRSRRCLAGTDCIGCWGEDTIGYSEVLMLYIRHVLRSDQLQVWADVECEEPSAETQAPATGTSLQQLCTCHSLTHN